MRNKIKQKAINTSQYDIFFHETDIQNERKNQEKSKANLQWRSNKLQH